MMMSLGGLEDDGFATSAAYAGADHPHAAGRREEALDRVWAAAVLRHLELTEAPGLGGATSTAVHVFILAPDGTNVTVFAKLN